jgi:hypothetical protein
MDNRIKQLMQGIVVTAICMTTPSVSASNCGEKVDNFLRSKLNYLLIVGSETSRASSECWSVIGMNRENRNKVTGLVAAGNKWAPRFVAINLEALDCGDLNTR